ncbi:MAG TPA: prepilin peptidase [Methylomirabilota bacterium]|nr:prepilin peptidase [Methylomirabilota bacterium]
MAGSLLIVLFARSGTAAEAWAFAPLLVALAAIAVLDVTARRIPDIITLPGLAYALLLAVLLHKPPLARSLLGVVIAGSLALLLSLVSRRRFGGGDVKLMVVLGAALGWEGAVAAFVVAHAAGALVIVGFLVGWRRWPDDRFPIGALIAVAGAMIGAIRG